MAGDQYSAIFIIYNPHSSSGTAQTRANRLQRRLKKSGMDNAQVIATEYAGHAEEIAYEAATTHRHPLLVSVSGDGGYNEVINGALRAQDEANDRRPVCAILAAGNANDHRRTVGKRPLARAIIDSMPEPIDVLRLQATNSGMQITRYAHSYIGFGLTSAAAARLNKERLTRWKEIRIVAKTLLGFRSFKIQLPNNQVEVLDSLVFANIHQMSKVIRLSRKTDLHNGMFLVATVNHLDVPRRLLRMVWISIFGLNETYRQEPFHFVVPSSQLAHFDGEVFKIPGGSKVKVEALREFMLTLR